MLSDSIRSKGANKEISQRTCRCNLIIDYRLALALALALLPCPRMLYRSAPSIALESFRMVVIMDYHAASNTAASLFVFGADESKT